LYAEKIAVGPQGRDDIDVTDSVENSLQRIAFAKNLQLSDLTVVMLDRPRHEALMEQVRQVGARITLLSDGDIAAAIMATLEGTGDRRDARHWRLAGGGARRLRTEMPGRRPPVPPLVTIPRRRGESARRRLRGPAWCLLGR